MRGPLGATYVNTNLCRGIAVHVRTFRSSRHLIAHNCYSLHSSACPKVSQELFWSGIIFYLTNVDRTPKKRKNWFSPGKTPPMTIRYDDHDH